jgi:hypothetical protein
MPIRTFGGGGGARAGGHGAASSRSAEHDRLKATRAVRAGQDRAARPAPNAAQRDLDTHETARGLIVNLSDVSFDTASSTLKPGAREKLARVSGILVSHDGLQLRVEGHTDSVGRMPTIRGSLSDAPNRFARILVDQKFAAGSSVQPALVRASRGHQRHGVGKAAESAGGAGRSGDIIGRR